MLLPPEKIKQSLTISWKEGIPASVMISIMDYFIIPYSLFLGASSQQIGFIVAVPHLLSSIIQLFSVRAIRFSGNRLSFLVYGCTLQAILLLPIAFVSLISFEERIRLLIFLLILFRIIANLIATAWGSLISDYLPPEKRGHYLGWRSQIIGIAGLVGLSISGILLFLLKEISEPIGFFVLFLSASLCRFLSSYLMSKMSDLPMHSLPDDDFTFFMFIRRFRESNFVKFVLFVASIIFTTYISAPYFSVYLLRDLHFSYLSYVIVQLAGVIAGLIAFPIWGKHADVVGNAKLLKLLSLCIPFVPLALLLSSHLIYIMAVEFMSGFIWGGFNLCATNFIYDAVSSPKRIRCISYFTLISGIATFLGASLGGLLAEWLPPIRGSSLLTLFIISGTLRFGSHLILSGKFKEIRETKHHNVSRFNLFVSAIGLRPLEGLTQDHKSIF